MSLTARISATLVLVCGFVDSRSLAAPDSLAIVTEAFEASRLVVSGKGNGTFVYYERADDDKPWQEKTKARISVYFDKDKYHVRLEFEKDFEGDTKRIIVYDGSAVMCSCFSPGISVSGCAGDVYDGDKPGSIVAPQLCGVPWDITKLVLYLSNPTKMTPANGQYRWSESENGDYVCESGDRVKVRQTFARAYGYNASAQRVLVGDAKVAVQEKVATWRQDKGIWYIDSFSDVLLTAPEKGKRRGLRYELKYDEFEVNAAVPAEMFTMGALEMPGATRITDRRRKATDKFYYVPVDDRAMDKAMDGLVAQLNTLPTARPSRQTAQTPPAYRWLAFVCINIGVLALIVFLVWRRRRAPM